jgi:proteasome lid subunit RPN8/RPN11
MTDWREDAVAHAQRVFPQEACGLVYAVGQDNHYFECENLSGHSDHFKIGARSYAACEELGTVVAVFHSHPYARAAPSAADLASCESSGLPWHILSLPNVEWGYCAPTGQRVPLLGRVFVHGVHDCYSIIRDGILEYCGITIPDFEREDEWWKKGGDLYLDNFGAAGFLRVHDELRPYDVILMQVCSDVVNHAALYMGDDTIIHHLYGRLSTRETYGNGYYRKHTRMTLRHRDLCAK